MAYVDLDFYNNTYGGGAVEDTDFAPLLDRAEELVEELTMYRLTPVTFLVMPEDTQLRVRKAVCAQIEYLDANGGADLDNGVDMQSASLGKFSYSSGGSATGEASQSLYAPRAQRLLAPTGLLYRGGCL